MKKYKLFIFFSVVVLFIVLLYLYFHETSKVAVFAPAQYSNETLIIDAGHGGVDGGAVSVTGAVESTINLAIAQRLDAICGLYGVQTLMLRNGDISLHDDAAVTIREKKVSDLHNRVAMIEATEHATLISIHQNSYTNAKYSGAQVFYANGDLSSAFAQTTQENLRVNLTPDNTRQAKPIPGTVYLMNNISCRAILVECGFLTNYQEDALLQTSEYQTKLATVLAGSYLESKDTGVISESQ